MPIDLKRIAAEYYFGDLQYWKVPRIAADALEWGYDGPALRRLAGLANRSASEIREDEIRTDEIDTVFREMGVDAPVKKENARLTLAIECAHRVLNEGSNPFDEATHIRIHLCELSDPPEALRQIVNLSKAAVNAPSSQWNRIEAELRRAFATLLQCQETRPLK